MEILQALVLLGGGFVSITLIMLACKVLKNGNEPYANETKEEISTSKNNEWEFTEVPTERAINTLLE